MLLAEKTVSVSSHKEAGEANAAANTVFAIISFVRRQFWLILFSLLLGLCVGALYLVITRPTYTASATMLIDSRRGGVQQKSVLGEPSYDGQWVDTQLGVLMLERDKIGLSVARQLELGKKHELYETDNGYLGALIDSIVRRLTGGPPPSAETEQQLTQRAAAAVAGGLDVKRVGFSYLVNINFSSPSQELAARVANAAADAYVTAELNAKYESLRQASDWLQERYQTLREQASAAERAVVEFKSENNIVTADGKLLTDQQLTEINNRLGVARGVTADKQARLNQIEAIVKDQEVNGTVDGTVADALANPIITRLRGQYLDLINKEADWSKRFGTNHLAVVNLRNQARDIRYSTHEELKRIADSYKSELEIAKNNERELQKQLNQITAQIPNEAQIALRGLETSAQSYRAFYDNFLQNYTESVQQQSSPIPDARVVAYAPSASKNYPSTSRTIILAILGGIALGAGLGWLREVLDRSFRTTAQVQIALDVECLARVPLLKKRRTSFHPNWTSAPTRERIISPAAGALRLVDNSPFSGFAESIRALKLAVDSAGPVGSTKVVGFTSSVPQEGKSTISAALAGHIAEVGARVILVDCDLRNPALSGAFARHADSGIIDVLSGAQCLEQTIWKEAEINLDFLPAGKTWRLRNTSQILQSGAMKQLFDLLRARYEYIIVDLSPLAPVVDVRATPHLCDFYLLLIEWAQTKVGVVQQALQEARAVNDNLLGVVLNKVDINIMSRYDYYHSEHYHNKYFAKYYQMNEKKSARGTPAIN